MKVLLIHPSPLMYAEIYLRLEPLGLEYVGAALRSAGHEVKLVDLNVFNHRDLFRQLDAWRPDAVAFSLNYLANIPEVLDLAKAIKLRLPGCFVFAGGHVASFIPEEILDHAEGAIDCIVRGEGEEITPRLIDAWRDAGRKIRGLEELPGVVTREGAGPPPTLVADLDRHRPARDLTRRRRRYFIGHLDPCASVEFTRGCPWDCSFCSAWTFYGRSYRKISVDAIVEDMKAVREPHVFIVDDVAFVKRDHSMEIAEAFARHGFRKLYYIETRVDILLNHQDVFKRWVDLGLVYMFLGIEALDEEGLREFRKRTSSSRNMEALAVARKLGIEVAVNIIANPAWEERDFERLRKWAYEVPEIVHVTVQTPYPGTEIWHTKDHRFITDDYRLFDVQHAVVPTKLPLEQFYEQVVRTQSVLAKKHLGWNALKGAVSIAAQRLIRGQTNFVRMLWKFSQVYNSKRQYADHFKEVRYRMRLPGGARPGRADLPAHQAGDRPLEGQRFEAERMGDIIVCRSERRVERMAERSVESEVERRVGRELEREVESDVERRVESQVEQN